MARIDNLTNFVTDVAEAIKNKKGTTAQIPCANFDTEIESIQTGSQLQIGDITQEDKSGDSNFLLCDGSYYTSGKYTNLKSKFLPGDSFAPIEYETFNYVYQGFQCDDITYITGRDSTSGPSYLGYCTKDGLTFYPTLYNNEQFILCCVTKYDGIYYAINSEYIYTSIDGINFNTRYAHSIPGISDSYTSSRVIKMNDYFYVMTSPASRSVACYKSSDLMSWTSSIISGVTKYSNFLSNGVILTFNVDYKAYTSTDGVTWVQRSWSMTPSIVKYVNGYFWNLVSNTSTATSSSAHNYIYRTTDFITIETIVDTSNTYFIYSNMFFDNEKYIIYAWTNLNSTSQANYSYYIMTSDDGITFNIKSYTGTLDTTIQLVYGMINGFAIIRKRNTAKIGSESRLFINSNEAGYKINTYMRVK